MTALSSPGGLRHLFHLPEGIVYLDGNSLGPLPVFAPDATQAMLRDQWGDMLIGGWNKAGWMDMPGALGDRLAPLIGAPAGTVVLGDTLSIKVYQALAAALAMRPDRKIVLSDTGNFPTDLYMAQGLMDQLDHGHALKTVAPADVLDAIDASVAVVMLTHVDYRTGRMHDMQAITAAAHEAGAVVVWDLAHSAGAVALDLAGCRAEFAIGCTYKYLNGGPGAPAFIYVREDLHETIEPALAGWLGHKAPFAFDLDYAPGQGIARMRVGTPPVIQMTALSSALDAWEGVSLGDMRAHSIALSEAFIHGVEALGSDARLASPRDPALRGSHVSFHHPQGYAVMQALIAQGVVGDFRAPD
ncbi:MAG: aminotransferase class V-fold PLP-dependent enzyme, partial [Ahrensia sp.]